MISKQADRFVWALLFLALGTMLIANRPTSDAGWVIVAAVVSYTAAAVFLFLLIVRRA
jgi:hypothetical protein